MNPTRRLYIAVTVQGIAIIILGLALITHILGGIR